MSPANLCRVQVSHAVVCRNQLLRSRLSKLRQRSRLFCLRVVESAVAMASKREKLTALEAQEAALQAEISKLTALVEAKQRAKQAPMVSAEPTAAKPPSVDAVDILTGRLEQMLGAMHHANATLDKRDERLTRMSTASPRPKALEPVGQTFAGGGTASAVVEVMAMMKDAPTEALVAMLQQLRASNDAADAAAGRDRPSTRDAPPTSLGAPPGRVALPAACTVVPASGRGLGSLSLKGGEASALVETMAMLDAAPTEALPHILERIRSLSESNASTSALRPALQSAGHYHGALTDVTDSQAEREQPRDQPRDQPRKQLSNQPSPSLYEHLSPGMRQIAREIEQRRTAAAVEEAEEIAEDSAGEVEAMAEASAAAVATASVRAHHAAAMESGRARLLRHILSCYFRKHAPDSIHKVEALVARVVGGAPTVTQGVTVGGVLWTEMELFGKLEAKYGAKVDLDPQECELN